MFKDALMELKNEVVRLVNAALIEEALSARMDRANELFRKVFDEHNKELEHIYALLGKYFEPPCQYEYNDIDAFDLMNTVDKNGVSWCEENCSDGNYNGGVHCWRKFFEILQKCENEMLEYGREQDADKRN